MGGLFFGRLFLILFTLILVIFIAGVKFDLSGLGSVVSVAPAAAAAPSLPRLLPPVPPPRRRRPLSYSYSCSDLTTTTRLPDKGGNGNDLRCGPTPIIFLKKKGSESGLDSNSAGSDYLSFQGSDCDEGNGGGEGEDKREVAGEREQRMILEDAGLILRVNGDDARVKSDSGREVLEKTIRLGDDDDGKEKKKEEEKKRRRRRERRSPPVGPVGPRALSLTRGQQSRVAVSESTAIDPSDESSIVDSDSTVSIMPQQRRRPKRMVSNKDLPPTPSRDDDDGDGDDINRRLSKLSMSSSWSSSSSPPTLSSISNRTFDPDEHAKRLDDAFERYESFKKAHLAANYNNNRLSVVSATSTDSSLVYPLLSPTTMGASVMTPASSKEFETDNLFHQQHLHPHHRFSTNLSSLPHGLQSHISQFKSEESPTGMPSPAGSRYSQLLQFLSLGRAKTPEHESGVGRKVTISGPIAVNSMSGEGDGSLDGGNMRSDSPAFGSVSSEVFFVKNHVSNFLWVVLGEFSG